MDSKLSGLSIFFPCFNDGENLKLLVPQAITTASKIAHESEIIIVENGSQVPTLQILTELEKKYPFIRVLSFKKPLGYGGALQKGFEACKKEFIFYTDGDGQYDIQEIPRLIQAMSPDIDVVNGYKTTRHDKWHRILIGWIYHYCANLFFGLNLRDVDCDFRLFRKKVVENLHLKYTSGAVCVEMMKKIRLSGFTIQEVPVSHYARQHGSSQFFKFKTVIRSLRDLAYLGLFCFSRRLKHCQKPDTYRKSKAKQT